MFFIFVLMVWIFFSVAQFSCFFFLFAFDYFKSLIVLIYINYTTNNDSGFFFLMQKHILVDFFSSLSEIKAGDG